MGSNLEPGSQEIAQDYDGLGFEESAGFLSELFVSWFSKVLKIGKRRTLELSDLGPSNSKDNVDRNFDRMENLWLEQVDEKGLEKANFLFTLIKFIGLSSLSVIFSCALLETVSDTILPLVSKRFLEHLEGSNPLDSSGQIIFASAFFLIPLFSSILLKIQILYIQRSNIQLFSSLSVLVYRKSLKLSLYSKTEISTGRLVNLMSKDAGIVFNQAIGTVIDLLISVPQFFIVLVLLWNEMGSSMLVGFIIISLNFPLVKYFYSKMRQVTQISTHYTDERLKYVNDMINGIRVVKFNAWEDAFSDVIDKTRQTELRYIKKQGYYQMVGMGSIVARFPEIMQLAVFFVMLQSGVKFTPSRIFTAIQLFNLVKQPVAAIPAALGAITQIQISLSRMNSFLRLHQKHNDGYHQFLEVCRESPTVEFLDCNFSWIPKNIQEWELFMPQSAAEKRAEQLKMKSQPKLIKTNVKSEGKTDTAACVQKPMTSTDIELSAQRKPEEGKSSVGSSSEGTSSEGKSESKPTSDKEIVIEDLEEEKSDESEQQFSLKNINLSVKLGELVAVVGPVGSGKTSLLHAILNEMSQVNGDVNIRGKISYAPQQPWIQNNTIRNNILFGLEFNKPWYEEVIIACALIEDLRNMPAGDQTEIGERGINLSGGQKARIGLARAVYSNGDIMLLDDPLAAVDAHVGEHLFNICVCDTLRPKTVILVTNHLDRLPRADKVIWMNEGKIREQGSFKAMKQSGVDFSNLLAEHGVVVSDDSDSCSNSSSGSSKTSGSTKASGSSQSIPGIMEVVEVVDAADTADTVSSSSSSSSSSSNPVLDENVIAPPAALVQDESKEHGKVSWKLYFWFLNQCGICLVLLQIVTSLITVYLKILADGVMAIWTQNVLYRPSSTENYVWFGIFSFMVILMIFTNLLSKICTVEARFRGSKNVHKKLMNSIIRGSIIKFFDVTPVGRILNQFSKDIFVVDKMLLMMMIGVFLVINALLSMCFAISLSTNGLALILFVPIFVIYMKIFSYVRYTSVDLQRLESVSRSPIVTTFQEILSGLTTVRAFGQEKRFEKINVEKLTQHIIPLFMVRGAMPAWLGLRLNLMGAMITGFIASYSVLIPHICPEWEIMPGMIAMSLTYGMVIPQIMMGLVFILTSLETNMVSAERLHSYITTIEKEREDKIPGALPHESWPYSGKIEINDLVVGYREGPNILHFICANIQPGDKVGIAGRTGSGKSTFLLALFRMVEARSGSIVIDGVDISTLGLFDLRSRLGIIPQDPVLFTGTLRYNIDPFNSFTELEIWDALNSVGMRLAVAQLPKTLDFDVKEGGENFSLGERQLLCMARAILRDPMVMCMDEATASIDSDSDERVQGTIRRIFSDKTVITIAHRLETIMDNDQILVLDQGELLEDAHPAILMNTRGSHFRSMATNNNFEHLKSISEDAAAYTENLLEEFNAEECEFDMNEISHAPATSLTRRGYDPAMMKDTISRVSRDRKKHRKSLGLDTGDNELFHFVPSGWKPRYHR